MGDSMRILTLADFTPRLGTGFEVAFQAGSLVLKLQSAQELPSMGRSGGSFRLEFIGPHEPMLPQATLARRPSPIFALPVKRERPSMGSIGPGAPQLSRSVRRGAVGLPAIANLLKFVLNMRFVLTPLRAKHAGSRRPEE